MQNRKILFTFATSKIRIFLVIIAISPIPKINGNATNTQLTTKTTMDLVNRLKFFLEENKIAISQFADKCRIPRPTLSQILNGRNKKISDELITKIHDAYPDLSVLWLMFGEGHMLTSANTQISAPLNGENHVASNAHNTDLKAFAKNETSDSPYRENSLEKILESEIGEQEADRYLNIRNSSTSESPTIDSSQSRQNFVESQRHITSNIDGSLRHSPLSYNSTEQVASSGELNFADGYKPTADFKQAELNFAEENDYATRPDIHNTNRSADQPQRPNGEYASIEFISAQNEEKKTIETTPNKPTNEPQGMPISKNGDTLSVHPLAGKKITNIVVFYSDNSFQSFLPSAI